jgi:hypothetical protein
MIREPAHQCQQCLQDLPIISNATKRLYVPRTTKLHRSNFCLPFSAGYPRPDRSD